MLINCVAYQDGQRLASLDIEAVSDYLEQPDCFVWVALRDATPDELDKMREEFGLHELAIEDARHGHQRPKLEEYGDTLFVVMHLIEHDGEQYQRGEIHVFVGRNFVLSIRNHSRQDFLGVRERCEKSPGLMKAGAGFVLYALLDAVVDRYFSIIDHLETRLEAIEARIFVKGSAKANIAELYALKREVMDLKHAAAPLMEVASRLAGSRAPAVCAGSRDYYRDVHDHLERINASIDASREMIGTAIQVNFSMVAIEENEVNKRLAAWGGIFAVATAFAGIWGMNFAHMPELAWEYGYPAALATIATACTLLYRRFKRVGWL